LKHAPWVADDTGDSKSIDGLCIDVATGISWKDEDIIVIDTGTHRANNVTVTVLTGMLRS
jgi:hypothetical protein